MRGGAQSCLMRCADGFYYVVKPLNNPQAPQSGRILVNDYLGTRIAALLGLPVPPCAVIEVTQELIELSQDLRIHVGEKSEPWRAGLHFGSRYPGPPALTFLYDLLPDEHLRHVENLDDFLGILVADKLACNVDGRQAIFAPSRSGTSYSATFCDFGFYFGAGEWKFMDVPMRGVYHRHRVYEGVRSLDSFERWLARMDATLSAETLGAIAGEIPLAWYEADVLALEQLIEELDSRRRSVRCMLVETARCSRQPFVNWTR